MRKMVAIICLTAMLFMLTGCEEGQSKSTQAYSSEYIVPDVSILAKDEGAYKYYYVLDNNTGVVYLQFSYYNLAGITVALNADGTPLTIDQIKRKNEDEARRSFE